MLADPPRPELWTRIAAVIAALRRLLLGAAPQLFGDIAAEARLQLAAANVLVRRYLHVLAAGILLPLLAWTPPAPSSRPASPSRRPLLSLFRLSEETRRPASYAGPDRDPPELQWAFMLEAVQRLTSVMANPQRHALRLARLLRQAGRAVLRALPVCAHILRRLAPWTDALICRLDEEARPQAWAAINARARPSSAG